VIFQGGLALSEDSHPNLAHTVLQGYSEVNIAVAAVEPIPQQGGVGLRLDETEFPSDFLELC
jgi:hypothetical protein